MKKKLGFISLGCSKNLVDTEMMVGIMEKAGSSSLRIYPKPR